MGRAMAHFRTDLYRTHLRGAGRRCPAPRPGWRVLAVDREVAAEKGQMILRADAFFDGAVFEPRFLKLADIRAGPSPDFRAVGNPTLRRRIFA